MVQRPTILQLIPHLDTGGAELSTIEIAEAIVDAGGRALVATQGGRLAGRITAAGGEIIAFPAASKNPLVMILNAYRLHQLIASEAIDLVHARSRAPAWSARLATWRSGVPFVTTYHGAYGENGRLKRLYNSVMVRADCVIANSRFTSDLIRERYGTPHDRITVIQRGVDLDRFDPAKIEPHRIDALRHQWGVALDRPIILQAARLTDWKGHKHLIEAAGFLRDRGTLGNAAVVLAGDAQDREGYVDMLRREIRQRGLDGVVVFPGHVADMAAAFCTAHVTVIASIKPEAFGRTATEAQAMGCPVIATSLGAPRETVLAAETVGREHATGWLVPPGDGAALAASLGQALALDRAARTAIGQRARAHVAAGFTLDAMKLATLKVYDQLLRTNLARQFEAIKS